MIEVKYVYLKSHPLFCDLEEREMKEVCEYLRIHNVYRGEIIDYGDRGNSKIFFLVKGKVKIAEANDRGDELIKDILTEEEFFGDLSLEGKFQADEYAEAMTANTCIAGLLVSDFRRILQDHPQMALQFARQVNTKLRKMEDRHADLVFRDAKSRLIRFIKNWALMDGNRVGDKIILNNYLTHSEIAGFIATSRQSVNVMFNELRDSGILFYNRKRIELNDPIIWN